MNRDQIVGTCRNGTASRRQERRYPLTVPAAPNRLSAYSRHGVASRIEVSLPFRDTQQAGLFDLMAARRRIAELEAELDAVRNVASTDPLTGVLNRRGLDDAYQREMARARRSGAEVVLALIDLDDFKHLNDVYGHQAGDDALVHLVAILRAAMRPSDVLSRFGGEEFVLLLTETTLGDAVAAIERFQRELAASPVSSIGARLAFSAGVVLCDMATSVDAAICRADAAAYAAKRDGKNCVRTG